MNIINRILIWGRASKAWLFHHKYEGKFKPHKDVIKLK
jgi:hypothetical protein